MYLKPLEIRFSQDSIGSTFGHYTSHPFRPIGNTLDDILSGRCNINSIPNISVIKRNGLWFTADNRRLWVFQEAEKRGKCSEIYVRETSYINYNKFTTVNNGVSIYVRGDPGGFLWRRMREVSRDMTEPIPEVSTMYSDSFIKTSTDSIVSEISTKQIDKDMSIPPANFRQHSLENTNSMFPIPPEDDSSDSEESYLEDVRKLPKPAEDDPPERPSECEANYSMNMREGKVEEMEVDFDKKSESFSDITDISGNNHDEKPSMRFSFNEHSDCISIKQSSELSNNPYGHYGVSRVEDEVKISAVEIVATTEEIKGTVMENKAFVGDELVMGDNKSSEAMEKEKRNLENKISKNQIRSISDSKLLHYRKEHFILNMENMSRKRQKKCTLAKKILRVSSIALALLLVLCLLLFLLHLLWYYISNI
ncbi:uncharacterized protein LOC134235607 [Saccostrea cucullata]|uniref:uncharacterized protein LOC134235607 n=1 Tax=Saccostrea cuccullata TaxID=36930 RepID=UPI002ED2BB34